MPEQSRRIDKLSTFKRQLKSHLFSLFFSSGHPMSATQIRFTISGAL